MEGEGKVSHATWHPPRSPAPVVAGAQGDETGEGISRSLHNSPNSEGVPRSRLASRKHGFNMKGMLKSVSTHSFTRRTYDSGAASTSKENMAVESKGWLLERQGKLDQAELMYSRHCLRSQKHHGKESLPLADNIDRLVQLLHKEGKLEEAEPLSRRSLDIRRKSLGEDSPQVATAMVNLGRVLEEKGNYKDALLHLKKGLAIREKVLEEGHPDTVSALAWIGDIHCKQEEYAEALAIARRVANAHEARLGPDDIKVGSSLNNVAGLLASMGKAEEALPLFTRSHEIYVRHLGENHPHSVATQLWVQQLSAPPPPPPARSRRSLDGRQAAEDRLPSPPPPLIEGNAEGPEEESSSALPLPEQQPVCC